MNRSAQLKKLLDDFNKKLFAILEGIAPDFVDEVRRETPRKRGRPKKAKAPEPVNVKSPAVSHHVVLAAISTLKDTWVVKDFAEAAKIGHVAAYKFFKAEMDAGKVTKVARGVYRYPLRPEMTETPASRNDTML